jgi:membrane fusion protein (multidrug efflux system)
MVFIGLLTLVSGCEKPVDYPMPPPAVVVQTIVAKPINTGFEFVGRTEAVEDVNIRPRVQGYLLKTHFTEGEVVQKGDLLFEIDPQPYIAAAAKAKADLASARAQANVARQNYRRAEQLLPKGTISKAEYEELKGAWQTGVAVEDAAEAALESAELNLSYTKIEAAITGRIGRKSLSIGDLATPDSVLATLVQQDPVYVTFQVNEKTVVSTMEASREAGREAHAIPRFIPYLTLPNGSEYPVVGEMNFLDNRVDPATGTVTVRTVFANPDGLLIPGQYVSVSVRNENPRNAIAIPQRAVQEDQMGRFVLVLDPDNTAHISRVTLGSRVKAQWIVESGVSEGDRIIVDGIQKVRVGQPVDPREDTESAPNVPTRG